MITWALDFRSDLCSCSFLHHFFHGHIFVCSQMRDSLMTLQKGLGVREYSSRAEEKRSRYHWGAAFGRTDTLCNTKRERPVSGRSWTGLGRTEPDWAWLGWSSSLLHPVTFNHGVGGPAIREGDHKNEKKNKQKNCMQFDPHTRTLRTNFLNLPRKKKVSQQWLLVHSGLLKDSNGC